MAMMRYYIGGLGYEWFTEAGYCPKCGLKLQYFSGLEQIPEYLYCQECNDCAYDTVTLDAGNGYD